MRKYATVSAVLVACLAAVPAAWAGDFFVNGQIGRIELDDSFDGEGEQTNLLQGSLGYRWGIGMAQIGLEGGVGKLSDLEGQERTDYTGGFSNRAYSLSTRYGFVGLNARIKPPVLPVFFIGRAGYMGYEQELDETFVDQAVDVSPVTERREFEDNGGGTYLGVGVGTSILPLLDVSLMLNQYRYSQIQYDPFQDEYRLSEDKQNARSVNLSVEYRF